MRATLTVFATVAFLSLAQSAGAQPYGPAPPGSSSYPPPGSASPSSGTYPPPGSSGSGYPPAGSGSTYPPPGSASPGSGYPPPESQDPNDPSSRTEQELEESERKDSGRGLEFVWLNAEIGVQYLDLGTFKADHLVDASLVGMKQTGLLYGAGLGVRVLFLTLGARFRMDQFSEWRLWTLGAELGLRIPIGKLDPYVNVAAGFASMGGFDADTIGGNASADAANIKGYDVRLGGGLDYYVTPVFSIGANVSLDVVGLKRAAISGADASYAAAGTSAGLGVSGTALLGLHF